MTETQVAILHDNRLSEQARIMLLWIASQEGDDGWVEAPFDTLRQLLRDYPTDDTISRHLRTVTGSKWAERRPGGRGHADCFKIIAPCHRGGLNALSPLPRGGAKRTVVVEGGVGITPLYPPLAEPEKISHTLDERVEAVLADESHGFSGFRSALRDYLTERVPPRRQHGYVRLVQTWLDGTDMAVFRMPDGTRLEPDKVPRLMAEALNDLMASDEAHMKRPIGDPANLRTKIDALLRLRGRRHDSHPGRGNPPTAPGSQAGQPTSSISGARQGQTA